MPFLSIIVPVYDVEKYLRQCLDSILAQTFTDFELILVEDGSPDGCAAICDEYAARDSRVSVLHKSNEGVVRARKDGLSLATGSFIGFVDSDDWVEPNMFQKLCEAARATGADIVGCQFLMEWPDRHVKGGSVVAPGVYDKRQLERDVHPVMLTTRRFGEYGIVPALWCKIFRREILAKHMPPVPARIRNGEDGAVTYPCLLDADSICLLDDALYRYRQHPSQTVRRLDARYVESLLLWVDYVSEHGLAKDNEGFLDQIAYYAQYKATLILDATFGNGLAQMTLGDRWTVLKMIAGDQKVSKMLARRDLGPMPRASRASLALIDSVWWPLVIVLYPSTKRAVRAASGMRRVGALAKSRLAPAH